jgi:diguanylate cyclase (GGDEF)-like protein
VSTPPHQDQGVLLTIEQEELRGLSRTVAEIHWLLLIVVLLFLLFGGSRGDAEAHAAISSGLFFYAALVMAFRYANFYRRETRWKIGIETLGMIALVAWALRHSGGLSSPLLNTFLLPIITSALTLGKLVTIVEVGLVVLCEMFLGAGSSAKLLSITFVGGLIAQLAPVLLVAYVTMMFSADIRYGLNHARLLSQTDELTGLYNRRGFGILANRLFGQAIRYQRPASVLMVDSDNLKSVNDTHGHEAGNQLLKQIAKTILSELRFSDVAARYGGDEFILLLPETPAKGALDVAERIRSAIASAPVDVGGIRVKTSVSIGVATYPEDGRSIDSIVARADRSLYQAKEEGRNRVLRFRP